MTYSLKSLRLFFLISVEYLKRNWQLFFILSLLLIALILLQIKFRPFFSSATISLGLVGTYQQHDLPLETTQLLSQGLTKIDESGRTVQNLVSGWEVNSDATEFKFKIKDNLTWSDGSKVVSSDLEIPIPDTKVNFPDSSTIEFLLKEPYSPFPSLLTKPIFKKGTLIGIGPYRVSRLEKSRIFITKILLEPFNQNLPNVLIRFYPNEEIAVTGFTLGEVQSLFGISGVTKLNTSKLTRFKNQTDYNKIVTIFYNTKDPVLSKDNKPLRQALSFATPVIEGEIKAANPIPPFSWAYKTQTKDYLGKMDDAKIALEKAKSTSSSELLKKELVLTTIPQLEEVGRKVVAAWQELGLDAVLRVESGIPQNFQALLITQSIPADPDQYFLWHSTQDKTNLTKYSFARVDKDLEDGRKALDEGKRKEKYDDFQRVLLEDAPATFLYFPKYNIVYLKKAEETLNQILPILLSNLMKD